MVMLSIIRNLCSIIGTLALFAFFYYWFKRYLAYRKAGENYQSDEQYLKYKKLRRISGIICLVGLVIGGSIPLSAEEKAEEEQKKIVREVKKEQDKTAQAQKEADEMFEKLDAITPKKADEAGLSFQIFCVGCTYCGKISAVTISHGVNEKIISGSGILNDKFFNDKCKKSPDGKHTMPSLYHRDYVYRPSSKKWELTKEVRDKDLYIQCLLKQQ